MKKSLKLCTSLAVIFGSFCVGLCISIQGPTLMDLIDILHVNQDMMSYSLAYAGLAYSFGGFLSGFIFNYLNRQLLIAIYFMIFGIANLITPWIPSYLFFSVITFSKMMAAGGTDCGANVWILEMWPGQDAWLQALHFSFAMGTALGPVVAEPFLSPELPDEHELERLHGPNYSQLENFTMPEPGESRIYVPYSVVGISSIIASVALFVLYFYEPYVAPPRGNNNSGDAQQKAKGQQQLENYKIAQETGGKKTSIERLALQEKGGLECCEVAVISNNNLTTSNVQSGGDHHHHQQHTTSMLLSQQQQQQQPQQAPQQQRRRDDTNQLELVEVVPHARSPVAPVSPGKHGPHEQHDQSTEQLFDKQPPPTPDTTSQQQQQQQQQQQPQQATNQDDEITLAIQISEPAPPPGVGSYIVAPTANNNNNNQSINNSNSQTDKQTTTMLAINCQQPEVVKSVKVTSKAPDGDGPPPFYVIAAIFMAACCLLFYCGIEITSMNYLATFAVNTDLQLSKSTAAYLSSALTSSFAVGRGFGIWVAISVKPHFLFYGCVAGVAIGNVAMLFFANTNELLLWISVCFFGIGCGPMFPAIVSFYDEKISKVTNTVSGIFILASMFQVALSSLIVGHHIIDNALILIELNLISSVLLLVLFGSLHLLTKVKVNQRARKLKAKLELQATTTPTPNPAAVC